MAVSTRIGSRAGLAAQRVVDDLDVSKWPLVDHLALPEDRREQFLRRKRAIELYLAGVTETEIQLETGLSVPTVYKLIVHRCLSRDDTGQLMGWRGALPYYRIRGYERQRSIKVGPDGHGTAGALGWLFASPQCQGIQARFDDRILALPKGLRAKHLSKKELFLWFIQELRSLGLERSGQWPFNVERLGYVTILKYIDQVLSQHPSRQRLLLGGTDAQRKARAGDGSQRPVFQCLERVECDAHKLDVRMVVMIPNPQGGWEPRKIHRLWVIVLIDVASRAVLGYHLSLKREVGAEDVLRAIKSALSPWQPKPLQFSAQAYHDGAALPSAHQPRYVGACWDQFSVDGAMANICAQVETSLKEVVGAQLIKPQDSHSYASRRSRDDRPFIEAFFGRLAAGGFHRLAPTTASRPEHKHGYNPDQEAKAVQFQLEYAQELLDVLIANYNVTPHSGLGYRSPLAQLDHLYEHRKEPVRHALAQDVVRMVGVRKLCTLHGGAHSGRRPHFNFANARYSAEWLSQRADLLGQRLWLQIENEDDARWAVVSTQQGEFLGAVRAAPPWHLSPHTLYIRESIRSLDKRRLLHLSQQADAVETLIRYAEANQDKKLPVHPAYLEARRVLQSHVQQLQAQGLGSRIWGGDDGCTTKNAQPLDPEPSQSAASSNAHPSGADAVTPSADSASPATIPPAPQRRKALPALRPGVSWSRSGGAS